MLGVDYVKVGLYGFKTDWEAIYLLQNVKEAARQHNPKIKVAAVGYADAQRINGLDPMQIPEIAFKAKADVAMLDTAIKDGKTLFAFLSGEQLKKFVEYSHHLGLSVAFAGSLRKEDLTTVYNLGVDIGGLRGAACTSGDRVRGEIKRTLVHELVEIVNKAEKQKMS
jgi:hypothetical protein